MTNPTPVAWMHRLGAVIAFDSVPKPYGEVTPLYTEAQLNQARADALREAAEKFHCKRLVGKGDFWPEVELRRMAAEIEGENE